MKHLITFIAAIACFHFGFGQVTLPSSPSQCMTAVANYIFQRSYDGIKIQKDATSQLQLALEFVDDNCVSSKQVTEIAKLLKSDVERLEFCKTAYVKVADRENFYDVYDAFAYFSNAFRLYDHVGQFNNKNTSGGLEADTDNPLPDVDYPFYNYPTIIGYKGSTNCASPLDETVFKSFYVHIGKHETENERFTVATQLGKSNCFTVDQLMKISSLFRLDITKLEYAKNMYDYAYDIENYASMLEVLGLEGHKDALRKFLVEKGVLKPTEMRENCSVSLKEFEDAKSAIANQKMNNTRLTIAQQIIKAKSCFSAAQITEIVALFDFENSRLELAMYSYEYCVDRENYYKVNDSFEMPSSITKLNEYIEEFGE